MFRANRPATTSSQPLLGIITLGGRIQTLSSGGFNHKWGEVMKSFIPPWQTNSAGTIPAHSAFGSESAMFSHLKLCAT